MDLKELLGEELYVSVKEKLGDKKLIINDGSYLPKSKFDEKNDELKLLKEKITSLEETGKKAEEILKDNKELKKQYEQIANESKTQLELKDKQIANITKKTALSKALMEKGAKYTDLLLKEFDIETLELEGENIKGFDTIFTPIQEKYKELFPTKVIEGDDPAKGNDKAFDPNNNDWSFVDEFK